MKKLFYITVQVFLLINITYACFDTYLFVRKGSMAYPYRSAVAEFTGEYSVNQLGSPQNDAFFSNLNFYYGLGENYSVQVSLGSTERARNEFSLDKFGARGVYNILAVTNYEYTLDAIAQYSGERGTSNNEFEISFPNIFRSDDMIYVVHPTFGYASESHEKSIGGHVGMFRNVNEQGIIGIGAEYASMFGSSYTGNRLTESEFSASIFFGAHIGNSIYIQNEIAKGLVNSRDLGFALTTKIIL